MNSLIELAKQTAELEEMLIDSDGEITEEIKKKVSVLELKLPAKIDSYASLMDRMNVLADYYSNEAKYFKKISESACNLVDYLLSNIRESMRLLDSKELYGESVKFKLCASQPRVEIEDESKIPGQFIITETMTRIDKKAIAAHIKDGLTVPGARLVGSTSLRQYPHFGGKK